MTSTLKIGNVEITALIDATDLSARGGGLIYREANGVRIERAQPERVRRAWTPRAPGADQE